MGSKKDDDLVAENTAQVVGWKEIYQTLFDLNSVKFLCFMIPLIYYTVTTEQYAKGFAIYIGFLLTCDILYYGLSIAIFDPELVISHGYNFSAFFNDTLHSAGLDYGFNFYDGDYTKTRHQAQIDKFEYAYKQLNLQEGMSLLDCGCGCGDWLYWLQTEKNLKVVGVNITPQQGMSKKTCRFSTETLLCNITFPPLLCTDSERVPGSRFERDLVQLERSGLGKGRIGWAI